MQLLTLLKKLVEDGREPALRYIAKGNKPKLLGSILRCFNSDKERLEALTIRGYHTALTALHEAVLHPESLAAIMASLGDDTQRLELVKLLDHLTNKNYVSMPPLRKLDYMHLDQEDTAESHHDVVTATNPEKTRRQVPSTSTSIGNLNLEALKSIRAEIRREDYKKFAVLAGYANTANKQKSTIKRWFGLNTFEDEPNPALHGSTRINLLPKSIGAILGAFKSNQNKLTAAKRLYKYRHEANKTALEAEIKKLEKSLSESNETPQASPSSNGNSETFFNKNYGTSKRFFDKDLRLKPRYEAYVCKRRYS